MCAAEFPFPPERPCRTYMMDMVPSDAAHLPARFPEPAGIEPCASIPAEAWTALSEGEAPVRVGSLLLHVLLAADPATAGDEMRTPCSEEHLVIVDVPPGNGPNDVLIGCRIADFGRTVGRGPGVVPVLLPREGYDREPQVGISLFLPSALYRRQARESSIVAALTPDYAAALREAFLRSVRR